MITVVTTTAELARLSMNGIFVVRMILAIAQSQDFSLLFAGRPHAYFGFRLRI